MTPIMNRAAVSAVRIGSASKRDRWLLHRHVSQHSLNLCFRPEALVIRRRNHSLCPSTLSQLINRHSISFTSSVPDFASHQSFAHIALGQANARWTPSIIRPAITPSKRHFHNTILRSDTDDDASKAAKAPPKDDSYAKSEATTKTAPPKDVSAAKPEATTKTEPSPPKSPKKDAAKPTKGKPSDQPEARSSDGIRKVDIQDISPKLEGGPPVVDGKRQYTSPELTKDAAFHKAGLDDPTRPEWQNPLHHNNPDFNPKFFREDFDSEEEFQAAVQPAPPLDHADGTPSYPQYLHDLADDMVHLTMLEMNELLNYMADHYGFHEGILSPEGGGEDDGGGDEGDAEAPPPEAEKTAFDVKLVSFEATAKIKIIKEVRVVIPGLGLKEAKEMVEGAPVLLQTKVSKEVAEQTKAKLEPLGAVIEIA
jgi:large subunit ribosomal protein L7/L12